MEQSKNETPPGDKQRAAEASVTGSAGTSKQRTSTSRIFSAKWSVAHERLTGGLLRDAGLAGAGMVDDVRNQAALNCILGVATGRYDHEAASEAAYLWGTVKNTTRSTIRSEWRFRRAPDRARARVDRPEDPSDSAAGREVQRIVRDAVAELPPRYRTALCWELGIPDADEKVPPLEPRPSPMDAFRARKRLRELLKARYPDVEVLF